MAKNFTIRLILSILIGIFCYISNAEPQRDENMRVVFEKKYNEWKQFMNSPNSKILSDTTGATTLYFEEIVKLGIPGLPHIINKMEIDSTLWIAVRKITKKWFTEDELEKVGGNISILYLFWWNEGRKQTPQQFEQLYSEWKSLKNEGEEEEARKKYQRIKDLGITTLPYVMEKVEQGEIELIPIVSYLTDDAVKKDLTPSECVEWWNKNKDKWILPPVEVDKNI